MAKGKMGFEKGNYGSAKGVRAKAVNLSDAQLKRAGALKASKKTPTDISKTSRATEGVNKGRTLGPGNKPLTGSVKLANGQMAVYKAGKRVINVKSSNSGAIAGPTGGLSDAEKLAKKKAAIAKRGISEGKARNYPRSTAVSNPSQTASGARAATQTSRERTKAAMRRNKTKSATFVAPGPNANRPSFAKQQAAVAQALIDFRNATTEATKASAKRKYDQHVSVLKGIQDYFRSS